MFVQQRGGISQLTMTSSSKRAVEVSSSSSLLLAEGSGSSCPMVNPCLFFSPLCVAHTLPVSLLLEDGDIVENDLETAGKAETCKYPFEGTASPLVKQSYQDKTAGTYSVFGPIIYRRLVSVWTVLTSAFKNLKCFSYSLWLGHFGNIISILWGFCFFCCLGYLGGFSEKMCFFLMKRLTLFTLD